MLFHENMTLYRQKTRSETFPFKRMMSSNFSDTWNYRITKPITEEWTDRLGIHNSILDEYLSFPSYTFENIVKYQSI